MKTTKTKAKKKQSNTPTPSLGIYYLCRLPKGWKMFFRRIPDGEDFSHWEFWGETLAREVAQAWARARVGKGADFQRCWYGYEMILRDHTYAFPRGRVSRGSGGRFLVLHGSDWKITGFTKREIEQAFGLVRPTWRWDSHEQCHREDTEGVRGLFEIPEQWPSVSSDFGF